MSESGAKLNKDSALALLKKKIFVCLCNLLKNNCFCDEKITLDINVFARVALGTT